MRLPPLKFEIHYYRDFTSKIDGVDYAVISSWVADNFELSRRGSTHSEATIIPNADIFHAQEDMQKFGLPVAMIRTLCYWRRWLESRYPHFITSKQFQLGEQMCEIK